MSGGYFDYHQEHIPEITQALEQLIKNNPTEHRSWLKFTDETIEEFKKAREILQLAYIYSQRIDYLVSADDREEDFHKFLKTDLDRIKSQRDI